MDNRFFGSGHGWKVWDAPDGDGSQGVSEVSPGLHGVSVPPRRGIDAEFPLPCRVFGLDRFSPRTFPWRIHPTSLHSNNITILCSTAMKEHDGSTEQ